jgi:hypothetical protein
MSFANAGSQARWIQRASSSRFSLLFAHDHFSERRYTLFADHPLIALAED